VVDDSSNHENVFASHSIIFFRFKSQRYPVDVRLEIRLDEWTCCNDFSGQVNREAVQRFDVEDHACTQHSFVVCAFDVLCSW
jgi:hypothetical protein